MKNNPALFIKSILLYGLLQVCSNANAQLIQAHIQVNVSNYGSAIPTADGGFAIAAQTIKYGHDTAYGDGYVVKLNNMGQLQWAKAYGGSNNDQFTSIIQLKNSDLLAVGFTQSYGGYRREYIIRLDTNGKIKWQQTIGGGSDAAVSAVESKDGGLVVVGTTRAYGSGYQKIYVVKLDSLGNLLWTKVIGGQFDEYAHCIANDNDGGFIVGGGYGTANSGNPPEYAYIIKLDPLGNMKWAKTIGKGISTELTEAYDILPLKDKGYVFAGYTGVYAIGNDAAYLVKLDSVGNIVWSRYLVDNNTSQLFYSLLPTSDGSYICAGATFASGGTSSYLAKFDSSGTLQWTKTFGSSNWGSNIMRTASGGYLVASQGESGSTYPADLLLLDSTFGSCVPVGTGGTVDSGAAEVANTTNVITGGTVITPSSVVDSGGSATILCATGHVNPPVANFTYADTIVCYGSTVNFTDASADYPTSWKWTFTGGMPSSSSQQNPMVVYSTSGTYTVKLVVSNYGGADSITKTIHVVVNSLPAATITGKDSICPGVADTLTAGGGTTYAWNTGSTTSAIVVSPSAKTTYSVMVSNGTCSKDTSITVSLRPVPVVTVTGDSMVCAGNTVPLIASGANSYTWVPAMGLSCTNCANPYASPATSVTYTVTGTNTSGCTNSATKAITINPYNSFDLTGMLEACVHFPTYTSASIQACIYNNRCRPVSGTLKLVLDTTIHITNTIADTAAIVSGDTLIWHYDSLSSTSNIHCVTLSGTIDSLPITDSVMVAMFIDPVTGDTNPSNNSIVYEFTPQTYDCTGNPLNPDEKSVYPVGDISDTQQMKYTIHFQNTGASVANNVVIIDTLDKNLDVTTLNVVASSYPVITTVSGGNIVKFEFAGINLPDTTMSKISSQGVVQYTIKPKQYVVVGSQVKNTAYIYFDANPVRITNTTLNTLITGVPISVQNITPSLNIACFPNPFTETTNIVFSTKGKHYLEVDDITGRKLRTIQCRGTEYEMSRNGLAAGIYFIRAYDAGQKYVATTKVVVQ